MYKINMYKLMHKIIYLRYFGLTVIGPLGVPLRWYDATPGRFTHATRGLLLAMLLHTLLSTARSGSQAHRHWFGQCWLKRAVNYMPTR